MKSIKCKNYQKIAKNNAIATIHTKKAIALINQLRQKHKEKPPVSLVMLKQHQEK